MFSGDTSTRPWPIAVAARSARSDGAGTEPANAGSPSDGVWPIRYRSAVRVKSAAVRCRVASPMNAVLHDSANACSRSLIGAVPSALWKISPSTSSCEGQRGGRRRRQPVLEQRGAGQHLERRPRRERAVQREVEPAAGRHGHRGQHLAGGGVDGDQRRALVHAGQRFLRVLLLRAGRCSSAPACPAAGRSVATVPTVAPAAFDHRDGRAGADRPAASDRPALAQSGRRRSARCTAGRAPAAAGP